VMIAIDGSEGEGGGQILRTSLALSLVTASLSHGAHPSQAPEAGLLRQHLTAVEAAGTVGCAEVIGATLSSQVLEFRPGPVTPGNYRFAVGTAGSATLVLQTVLPSLLTASGSSTLTLEGGTHNPLAPSFDFLAKCFMPLIHRMGPTVELELKRPGFFPAGGGAFTRGCNQQRNCPRSICSSGVRSEAGVPAFGLPSSRSTWPKGNWR